MKRRILGKTELKVSELCLGTMNFGWKIDELTSYEILNAYRAGDGNFIQGLCVFPSPESSVPSHGSSLSFVGRWWRRNVRRRQDLVISVRLSWPRSLEAGMSTSPKMVERRCDEILRLMQTDYIDLLVSDWNEGFLSNPGFRHQLDDLVRTGKVRYHVVAHPRGWHASELSRINYDNNHARIEAIQADYSLMARVEMETELMDFCSRKRMGVLVSSPLAGGLLTRPVFSPAPGARNRFNRLVTKFGEATPRAVYGELADIAREKAATVSQLALAWVLHNPMVTSVILGGTTTRHYTELAASTRMELSPSDLFRLGMASRTQHLSVPPVRQIFGRVAASENTASETVPSGSVVPELFRQDTKLPL
jgi:aryl-alcohol dehydrogenase-like predicted oxidoreductase